MAICKLPFRFSYCTYVFLMLNISLVLVGLEMQLVVETATTRFYDFNVEYTNVNKLCHTKRIVTVNGKFPGPTIYAQEGDRVIVRVKNSIDKYNVTVHWHGVRQLLSCWFDGPAYITQCPIRPGKTFTYEFTLHDQKGTLFWHAHVNWLRATVHGPLIIYPKTGVPYPFPTPYAEHVIVLGEYWLKDANEIEAATLKSGGGPPSPDAYTINGHPGPRYACSTSDVHSIVDVIPGRTYLLRIINAALNNLVFFTLAQHKLTVVEADAEYTQPYTTDTVLLAPGQTLNVLVTANQFQGAAGATDFLMGMSTYISNPNIVVTTKPALAIWRYKLQPREDDTSNQFMFDTDRAMGSTFSYHKLNDVNKIQNEEDSVNPVIEPKFPESNDTSAFTNFNRNIRSFSTVFNRVPVPRTIHRHLFFTIGLNEQKCSSKNKLPSECQAPNGGRFAASMNNVSFRLPTTSSLLQSYYANHLLRLHNTNVGRDGRPRSVDESDYNNNNVGEDYEQSSAGREYAATSDYSSESTSHVYTTDFPDRPRVKYDYVGNAPNQPPNNTQALEGTRVNVIEYGANVQIILQNTGIIGPESHPIHLHGFSFYVVGSGSGDYDPALSTTFNLDDPPLRNTIAVPSGGWAAIRFKADNPGVWHLHCHLEIHTSWGLGMAFIVKNGIGSRQTLPQPPSDLPQC